jgi:hemerythrin
MIAVAFEWDDRYLVGHREIDAAHRKFTVLVDALLGACDDALAAALDDFARHAEDHFGTEERLMERYAFPARECHAEEHAKVLASVQEVRALASAGDLQTARELAQALADWFPGHTDYMDSALAIWVVRRTAGGAPVVLRRMRSTAGDTGPVPAPQPVRGSAAADPRVPFGVAQP